MIRPVSSVPAYVPPQAASATQSDPLPKDRLTLQGTTPSDKRGADPAVATQASISATVTGPLAVRLATLPVTFLAPRSWKIPLLSSHKRIDAAEAAKRLEKSEPVLVQTEREPLPVKLTELEALAGNGPTANLELPQLADALKTFKQDGLQLSVEGLGVDPYAAYHALSQKSPVEVRLGQLPVGQLQHDQTPPELGENLAKARQAEGDPGAELAYLGAYHQNDLAKITADLTRLEKGPRAADYASLRKALPSLKEAGFQPDRCVEFAGLLCRPLGQAELPEKLAAFSQLGLLKASDSRNLYAVKQAAWKLLETVHQGGSLKTSAERIKPLVELCGAHKEPLPLLEHAAAHPEQIDRLSRLLEAKFPPAEAARLAPRLTTSAQLELVTALKGKAELAETFLADCRPGMSELAGAAAARNLSAETCEGLLKHQNEKFPRREDALQAMAQLLQAGAAPDKAQSLLETVESFPDRSPLAQKLAAVKGLASLDGDGALTGAEALKKRLESGATLTEASKVLGKVLTGAKNIHGNWIPALEASRRLATDQLEVYSEMLGHSYHADAAAELTELLHQPLGDSSPTQRIKSFRELKLMDGGDPLNSYKLKRTAFQALRGQIERGESYGPAQTRVARLLDLGYGRKNKEHLQQAVEFFTTKPEAQNSFMKALEANLPVPEAMALAERGCDDATLNALSGLGGLKTYPDGLSVKCLEAVNQTGRESLPQLKQICDTIGTRRLVEPERFLELFQTRLAEHPDECRVLCKLMADVDRLEAGEAALEALRAPAGTTTLSERYQACQDAGIFGSHFEPALVAKKVGAVRAQVEGGASLAEATQEVKTIAKTLHESHVRQDHGEVFVRYAGSLAARPLDERRFFLELLGHNYHVDPCVRITQQVADRCGSTTLAERTTAFKELFAKGEDPFSFYAVKQAGMDHLRADVEAGESLSTARKRVQELMTACKQWPHEEVLHALQYARGQIGEPRAWRSFVDLVASGVKPEAASESLELARGGGDFAERLEAVRGLGSAGKRLDKSVALEFQTQLQMRLQAGADRKTALGTLKRVADAVGQCQQLNTEAACQVARLWAERLSGDAPATEVLCDILAQGWTADQAAKLLEATGTKAVTDALSKSGNLGPSGGLERSLQAAGAVRALKKAGLNQADILAELKKARDAASWARDEDTPAFTKLAELADRPEQRELYLKIVAARFHAEPAGRLLDALDQPAGRSTLAQRWGHFERAGLVGSGAPFNNYKVKEACIELLRDRLIEGTAGEAELTSLVQAVGKRSADEALQAVGTARELPVTQREAHRSLLSSGFAPVVAAQILSRAGDQPALHAEVLAGLGKDTELTPARAERAQALLTGPEAVEGLKALCVGMGTVPAQGDAALELAEGELNGKWASLGVLGCLLPGGHPADSSASLAERLAGAGGLMQALPLELLKARGSEIEAGHAVARALLEGGKTPEESRGLLARVQRLNVSMEVFRGPAERVEPLLTVLEANRRDNALQYVAETPTELLQLYPKVRDSGADPIHSAWLLGMVGKEAGATTARERADGLQRLIEVNDADRRTWVRMAVAKVTNAGDVIERQLLVPLAKIYRRLLELGKPAAEAAELVANIYSAEQARGITHAEMEKRLEQIGEVAKLEVRSGNTTVLLDSQDKVVFSGVTVRKRKAPPAQG